jgi:probable HAF family extracellular repeat protein
LWSVTGLNDKGQVIGTYGTEGVNGFVWHDGTMTSLGNVQPLAINDLGQIITFGGTVLHNGTTTALSPTDNRPNAISDTGLVVGLSGAPVGATIWQAPAAS